jgi:hypothetical protein
MSVAEAADVEAEEEWRQDWNETWLSAEMKYGHGEFCGLREEMNKRWEEREERWRVIEKEREAARHTREVGARDSYARAFQAHAHQVEQQLKAEQCASKAALQELNARRDAAQSTALVEAIDRSQQALNHALDKQRGHLDAVYSKRFRLMQDKYTEKLSSLITASDSARKELELAQQRCSKHAAESIKLDHKLHLADALGLSLRKKLSAAGKATEAVNARNLRQVEDLDQMQGMEAEYNGELMNARYEQKTTDTKLKAEEDENAVMRVELERLTIVEVEGKQTLAKLHKNQAMLKKARAKVKDQQHKLSEAVEREKHLHAQVEVAQAAQVELQEVYQELKQQQVEAEAKKNTGAMNASMRSVTRGAQKMRLFKKDSPKAAAVARAFGSPKGSPSKIATKLAVASAATQAANSRSVEETASSNQSKDEKPAQNHDTPKRRVSILSFRGVGNRGSTAINDAPLPVATPGADDDNDDTDFMLTDEEEEEEEEDEEGEEDEEQQQQQQQRHQARSEQQAAASAQGGHDQLQQGLNTLGGRAQGKRRLAPLAGATVQLPPKLTLAEDEDIVPFLTNLTLTKM